MRRRSIQWVFLCSIVLLFRCGSFYSGPRAGRVIESDPQGRYALGFVELDDQGWFMDRRNVAEVLKKVGAAVDGNGSTVVVYVHGWHHNAGSQNVADFRKTLIRTYEQLDTGTYKAVRAQLFPGARNRVVGVYVGWRGRALPGPLPITFWTFWNRRAAALRVGHGDVPEFLSRIHSIYVKGNTQPEKATPNESPRFAGLVIVGHSFGAQVVYSALGDVLKQRISASVDVDDVNTRSRVTEVIPGFGDLVVLVNPAAEAAMYQSISELVRDKEFPPEQPPVMLTLSSEGDWPNRWPFSFGRRLGVTQEPIGRVRQYTMKTHAIGNVPSQITHCLRLENDGQCAGYPVVPSVHVEREVSSTQLEALVASGLLRQQKCGVGKVLSNLRLGAEVRMQDERIRLQPVREGLDANLPFIVARTKTSIVSSHSDVFRDELREFVVRYASLVQSKRLGKLLQRGCPP